MSLRASTAQDGSVELFHGGVRPQLEATATVMDRMQHLTERTAAFKSRADDAEARLRDAAGRVESTFRLSGPLGKTQGAGAGQGAGQGVSQGVSQLEEALALAAARLTGAHLARWSACRKRVDDAVRALAVAVAHLDPVALPADFAETLRRGQTALSALRRALKECAPKPSDATRHGRFNAAAATAARAFGEHAVKAGLVDTTLAPGDVVDRAVQSLVLHVGFLEAILPHGAPKSADAGSSDAGRSARRHGQSAGASADLDADLDADLERQASDVLAKLQACADVARAASDMASAVAFLEKKPGSSSSSSLAYAVEQARQSLRSFGKARDGPGVQAAAQAVGWCRLAVARARMDGADEARASARTTHLSLEDPLAWASEAVRGRAFPVAFASARGRDAVILATRADKISEWYSRASAPLDDASAVDLLLAAYRELLRMK